MPTPIVRVTASPRLISSGAVTTVRFAGGGDRAAYRFGGVDYRGGLNQIPRFSAELGFNENGWTGGISPTTGVLTWSPSSGLADYASLYLWSDAAILVEMGFEDDEGNEPASWTTLLSGSVATIESSGGSLKLTIADVSDKLDKPLIAARFAGTGGVEGASIAANRTKRRSWGYVFNVEGRILDPANQVYEFGDPAFPWEAFAAVRDIGRAASPAPTILAWQGSIAATYSALQAAAVVQGSGVVAPSIACVKWWTTPVGPLTADIRGEIGAAFVTSPAQIARRILEAFNGGLSFDQPTYDAAVAARVEGAGAHIGDDSLTWANAVDRVLLGSSLTWVLQGGSLVVFRPIEFANSAAQLTAESVVRDQVLPPLKARRLGYQRNERQHQDGEIASSLLVSDVSGLGGLATKNSVFFNDPSLKEKDNLTTATEAAFKTSQGQAATIAAQAATATSSDFSAVTGATRPENNATSGDNLLKNSALLTDTSGWAVDAGITRVVGGAGDPGNYFRGTGYQAAFQSVTIPGGQRRVFMSTYKRESQANTHSQFYIYWFNASGAYIGASLENFYGSGYVNGIYTSPVPVNTWFHQLSTFNIPLGAVTYTAYLGFVPPAGQTQDFAMPRLSGTQAGADQTNLNPIVATSEVGAGPSDNLVRNSNLITNGANGNVAFWKLTGTATFVTPTPAVAGQPIKFIRLPAPEQFFYANQTHFGDYMPWPGGSKKLFVSMKARVDTAGCSLLFSIVILKNGVFTGAVQQYLVMSSPDLNQWVTASTVYDLAGYDFDSYSLYGQTVTAGQFDLVDLRVGFTEREATLGADINDINLFDGGELVGGVRARMTRGLIRTPLGTAAAIASQGALATKASVAFNTADVTGFGALAGKATANYDSDVVDGTTYKRYQLTERTKLTYVDSFATFNDNLVTNADLSDGTTGWDTSGFGLVRTAGVAGDAAAFFFRASEAVGGANQYRYANNVQLVPASGKIYCSFSIRANVTSPVFRFAINTYNAAGANTSIEFKDLYAAGANTWENVNFVLTLPAGTTKIVPYVQAYGLVVGAVADIGNIRFAKGEIGSTFGADIDIGVFDGGELVAGKPIKLTRAQVRTSLGTAAAITNQGAFATRGTIDSDSDFLSGSGIRNRLTPYAGDFNFLQAGRLAWTAGGTVEGLKPAEIGANVTETRTSAAITNQGSLATRNRARFGSGGHVYRANDTTEVLDADAITSLGQAATIASQGGLATKSAVTYGTADTLGFGGLAAKNRITLQAAEGGLASQGDAQWLVDADIKTNIGTAAAITGQGQWATNQRGIDTIYSGRANQLRNGGFMLGPVGWSQPGSVSFITSTQSGESPYAISSASGTYVMASDLHPAYANAVYSIQAELYAQGLTGGAVAVDLEWYSGSASLGVTSATITSGSTAWGRFRVAVTCPANANGYRVRCFASAVTGASPSIGWRRVKVSIADLDVPFTDEATDGANAERFTGRAPRATTFLPASWTAGIRSTTSIFPISDSDNAGVNVTVNIAAFTKTFDDGSAASYPAASFTGYAYGVRSYWWRDDPNLNGGSGYGSSTDADGARGTGKIYLGYWTTRSAPGSGGGGSPPPGECVAAKAFVQVRDRPWGRPYEQVGGDFWTLAELVLPGVDWVRTLEADDELGWRLVKSNHLADAPGIKVTLPGGYELSLSESTPMTQRDGTFDVLAKDIGGGQASALRDGVTAWGVCSAVELGPILVAHISCDGGTYLAGDRPGFGVFSHNPIKP